MTVLYRACSLAVRAPVATFCGPGGPGGPDGPDGPEGPGGAGVLGLAFARDGSLREKDVPATVAASTRGTRLNRVKHNIRDGISSRSERQLVLIAHRL
jgi:hypothetical protein